LIRKAIGVWLNGEGKAVRKTRERVEKKPEKLAATLAKDTPAKGAVNLNQG